MDIGTVEKRFATFLEKKWELHDIEPFLRTYIRLLFLFKDEISQKALSVILERQKQLLGQEFDDRAFDDLRASSRRNMGGDLGNENGETREAMLNRMLFCVLLDTEETDFFYMTEPMFEFVRKMDVSPSQLAKILESEFSGFRVDELWAP
jgi:hypothetical protein